MNSEKQVKDLTKEELIKIVKNKEESVACRLRSLIESKLRKEKEIAQRRDDLIEIEAQIHKLEGFTVEDAYEFINKIERNNITGSSVVWNGSDMNTLLSISSGTSYTGSC